MMTLTRSTLQRVRFAFLFPYDDTGSSGPCNSCGALFVVGVVADTGGVGHDVGDVVLLVHPVKQVGHWTAGKDGHVLSAVGL